jgi:hypothetical protein
MEDLDRRERGFMGFVAHQRQIAEQEEIVKEEKAQDDGDGHPVPPPPE